MQEIFKTEKAFPERRVRGVLEELSVGCRQACTNNDHLSKWCVCVWVSGRRARAAMPRLKFAACRGRPMAVCSKKISNASHSVSLCLSDVSAFIPLFSAQPVCDAGQQGREPGGPHQAGSRAAQVVHEGDGTRTRLSREPVRVLLRASLRRGARPTK